MFLGAALAKPPSGQAYESPTRPPLRATSSGHFLPGARCSLPLRRMFSAASIEQRAGGARCSLLGRRNHMRDQGETEGDTDIAVYSREERRDRLRSSRDRAEGKDWSVFLLALGGIRPFGRRFAVAVRELTTSVTRVAWCVGIISTAVLTAGLDRHKLPSPCAAVSLPSRAMWRAPRPP